MSRIKDYPEATSMADDDILVIDGDAGTRKVKKSKFVEIISEHVDGEISEMRQDFQAGVDTIVDAIERNGVTPSASTPQACADGIDDVAINKRTQGRNDKNSFTITVKRGSLVLDNGGSLTIYNASILINGIDITSFVGDSLGTIMMNKPPKATMSKTGYASYTHKVTTS